MEASLDRERVRRCLDGLTQVQRSLSQRIDTSDKEARAGRWFLPLLVLAALVVVGTGLWLVLQYVNRWREDALGTVRGRWGAGPGKKVAVVGLGGLGHLAVKIAHALGAEVTVLSQSLKKMDDGLRLGAREYFATFVSDRTSRWR